MRDPTPVSGDWVAVDGHVHLYSCFDLEAGLNAARTNLMAARSSTASPLDPHEVGGVILLTQTATEGAFERLLTHDSPLWRCEQADETALVLHWSDGPPLVVIAGRQFQSAERIEVLGIGAHLTEPDGVPLTDILDILTGRDIPAILPWGVGKWLGQRGDLIAQTVSERPGILLGDNAGRPSGWPAPKLFDTSVVLPGTDPLPRRGSEAGIGRYGFLLEGRIDLVHPSRDMRQRLTELTATPRVFGRRVNPLLAMLNQVRLRLPG